MQRNNFEIKSYSKINLGLKVLDLLPDNYHSICTIMQEIDFYDIIKINPNQTKKLAIKCDGPINVPDNHNNLCIKAAELIIKNYNIDYGVNIFLTKNIPIEAGLGGGSSNAATVLCSLNNMFKLNISDDELCKLAFKLGCDVPFFIRGGVQLSENKGEKLTPVDLKLTEYFFLLIHPNFKVSTKWAYSFFKNELPKTFDSDKFRSFQDDIDWKLFENDFENMIKTTYPEVVKIRQILESKSALFVSLSGSGSTMFGVFDDYLKADFASQALSAYNCHIVKPINRN